MASAALTALIQKNAPFRPYSANVKNAARPRSQAVALSLPYVQLNSPAHDAWLVLDVDRKFSAADWMDVGLPPPTYVASNPVNGHAHMGYALTAPVCKTTAARQAPLRYLAAIQHAYTTRLGADFGFTGPLAKNPLHPMWRLWEPANAPTYELGYLAEYVELLNRLPPRPAGLGRNCDMFDSLRLWSYKAIREFWRPGGADMWAGAVLRQAEALNTFDIPLGWAELKGIARSVSRYVWRRFTPGRFRDIQIERGRRGGIASGAARRAKSAGKRVEAQALLDAGLSQRAIASELQVGRTTVGRWLRDFH